jgi:hypothetical protein
MEIMIYFLGCFLVVFSGVLATLLSISENKDPTLYLVWIVVIFLCGIGIYILKNFASNIEIDKVKIKILSLFGTSIFP